MSDISNCYYLLWMLTMLLGPPKWLLQPFVYKYTLYKYMADSLCEVVIPTRKPTNINKY